MTNKLKWPKPVSQFKIPLYPGSVAVYNTRESYNKACKVLNINHQVGLESAGHTIETSCRKGNLLYLVGEFEGSTVTLGHELNHVTFMVLWNVGIDARNNAGEAFCYLQSDLMRKCGVN